MNFRIKLRGDFMRDRGKFVDVLKFSKMYMLLRLIKAVVFSKHIMDTQQNNNNNVTFFVYYAKIVVRVLMHSPLAIGSWTMRQNPDYYFGIVHSKCNIFILILQV